MFTFKVVIASQERNFVLVLSVVHPGYLFGCIPLFPDGLYEIVSPGPYSDAWVHNPHQLGTPVCRIP